MRTLRTRLRRLEKEAGFRRWLDFSRLLENLSDSQLEKVAIYFRFPDPMPAPLPVGMSKLDGLDRKTLLGMWEEEDQDAGEGVRINGILIAVSDQGVDWAIGLQGKVSQVSVDPNTKGKKAGTVVLEGTGGTLSLSIGACAFVYEEPREAKQVVREEAESATVSALSVFFPSNEVFVFYELREPSLKASLPGWSTI